MHPAIPIPGLSPAGQPLSCVSTTPRRRRIQPRRQRNGERRSCTRTLTRFSVRPFPQAVGRPARPGPAFSGCACCCKAGAEPRSPSLSPRPGGREVSVGKRSCPVLRAGEDPAESRGQNRCSAQPFASLAAPREGLSPRRLESPEPSALPGALRPREFASPPGRRLSQASGNPDPTWLGSV